MKTIPIFEGTPEGTVFENTCNGLLANGWQLEIGGHGKSSDALHLQMATPDRIRLVKPLTLLKDLGLLDTNGWIESGFHVEFDTEKERSYLIYEGHYDFEAATALARIVSASTLDLAA